MTNHDGQHILHLLENARFPVFFGGAGVSTESGIPDFRGQEGLYRCNEEFAEYAMSAECLQMKPETFFDYYRQHMLHPDARPNVTHLALAELERMGYIKAVITQNIDGLHQKAGSEAVTELHGSVWRNHCLRCGKEFDVTFIRDSGRVPRCLSCGAMVRPDVTLYGEAPDGDVMAEAEELIAEADVLIVAGTSLTVQPAASLIAGFQGDHLIIINEMPTPYDGLADWIIRKPLSEVFGNIL